jgi:CDP-glucose 4,6-dehydratase
MERRNRAMENLVMNEISEWAGKRVFLTGHTGFKGTWLCHLLAGHGALITGYSLPPTSSPNLFEASGAEGLLVESQIGDIRDKKHLISALNQAAPDIIIHLAAQPIVRKSYADPIETWETNVLGTANLLEAVRTFGKARAVVIATTDKCYENKGWHWGYRETDTLGGHDPYSASKAACEILVASYRKSFFEQSNTLVATARAGNVIGGGDWSQDRLIADAARAAEKSTPLVVRNPEATRPWQHVLDCLNGYLTLGTHLCNGNRSAASAYNFGPDARSNVTVRELLTELALHWPKVNWQSEHSEMHPHEAAFLHLDSSLARNELGWKARWSLETTIRNTALWYDGYYKNPASARKLMQSQIADFMVNSSLDQTKL